MPARTDDLIGTLAASDAFERSLEALAEFRKIKADMSIQVVAVYLAIVAHKAAINEWPRIRDIAELLAIPQQTASNIAKALSNGPRGLDLIQKRADRKDARAMRLALSSRGEALLERIAPLIG